VAHNWPVVEKFRNGEDIYCQNATAFYGRPITPADKAERTFGKILELQAGYGAGGHSIVLAAGRATPKVILTEEEGLQARNLYRSTHKPVVSLWYEGEAMLMRLHGDLSAPVAWRDVVEIKGNRMIGPNDSWMTYELERTPDGFIRQTRNGWSYIWGGHLVENLIQYLARVYLAQAMLRVRRHGVRVASSTHDEIIAVAPEAEADAVLQLIIEEMTRPIPSLPDCPLAAEGGHAERYSK